MLRIDSDPSEERRYMHASICALMSRSEMPSSYPGFLKSSMKQSHKYMAERTRLESGMGIISCVDDGTLDWLLTNYTRFTHLSAATSDQMQQHWTKPEKHFLQLNLYMFAQCSGESVHPGSQKRGPAQSDRFHVDHSAARDSSW